MLRDMWQLLELSPRPQPPQGQGAAHALQPTLGLGQILGQIPFCPALQGCGGLARLLSPPPQARQSTSPNHRVPAPRPQLQGETSDQTHPRTG